MEIGKSFIDFGSFSEALIQFQQESSQLFVIFKSRSVEAANKRLNPSTEKFRPELKWASLHYKCKNGGKPRFSVDCRSRPNQRTTKIECPSNFKVMASRKKQQLVVTECNFTHNHMVSEEVFRNYPENRRLNAEEFKVVALQVKPVLLQNMLQNSSKKQVTKRDVYNVIQKLSSSKNKYNFAMKSLQQVAECIADCAESEFDRRIKVIESLKEMWMLNLKVKCVLDDGLEERKSTANHSKRKRKHQGSRSNDEEKSKKRKVKLDSKDGIINEFNQLPSQEKLRRMLVWFVGENIAQRALESGQMILVCDLACSSRNLASGALDSRVHLPTIEKFFEKSAWLIVQELVQEKRAKKLWLCGSCKLQDEGALEMIACDLCLEWFHWQCVGLSTEVCIDKSPWVCLQCNSS